MIRFIKGTLAYKGLHSIIIERDGIGFEIFVPANSPLYLKQEGEEVKVFTEMIVREDDISLYGFEDMESLELFKLLITVSGVGAKAGLAIFTAALPVDIKAAIMYDDIDVLTRASGVGKKTAQRIVLELKDKIEKINISVSGAEQTMKAVEPLNTKLDKPRQEAVTALMELGYSKNEATLLVESIEEDLTVEGYIMAALRKA